MDRIILYLVKLEMNSSLVSLSPVVLIFCALRLSFSCTISIIMPLKKAFALLRVGSKQKPKN